jgi:hypothetical protein
LMEKLKTKEIEIDERDTIDGVLVETDDDTDLETVVTPRIVVEAATPPSPNTRFYLLYIFLPFIFLTVTLMGGMRLASPDGAFIFLKPALFCLIFGAILLVLFFRARLFQLDEWFSETFSTLKNAANGAVLLSLFAASTQLFNSLLPEQGLPFWVVAFCFFWTLWNNLFADFDTKKLLRSLGALFGLAFVAKYLVLANLTAPASENWLRGLIENPGRETVTWLLDLPRFSAGTGYIQFFAVAFYLIGLFLMPRSTKSNSMIEIERK